MLLSIFNLLSVAEEVLRFVLGAVVLVVLLYLFVSLYSAMLERRREIATMRALGARRLTILMIMLLEACPSPYRGDRRTGWPWRRCTRCPSAVPTGRSGSRAFAHQCCAPPLLVGIILLGACAGYSPLCWRTGPRSLKTSLPFRRSTAYAADNGGVQSLPVARCMHAAGLHGGSAAITFAQLVDGLRANNEVTQKIKSYNGKVVEMQGFIIPAGPPDLSFFLLSRVSVLGNYCCELPTGQDETVYVLTAKGVRLFYDPLRVYKVRGLFEAGMHTDLPMA